MNALLALLRVMGSSLDQKQAILEIAVSRDFCVFCVLEAAKGKFKETPAGRKVVYGTYKHFRSLRYEKWSYYGYCIAR